MRAVAATTTRRTSEVLDAPAATGARLPGYSLQVQVWRHPATGLTDRGHEFLLGHGRASHANSRSELELDRMTLVPARCYPNTLQKTPMIRRFRAPFVAAIAAVCQRARRLFGHRHHLVDALGNLCRELARGMTDLSSR